jgi:hypothetical protein
MNSCAWFKNDDSQKKIAQINVMYKILNFLNFSFFLFDI